MKRNPVNYEPGMKNGYIQPPYVLEEGEKINDMYLEPVLYHNENGPTETPAHRIPGCHGGRRQFRPAGGPAAE